MVAVVQLIESKGWDHQLAGQLGGFYGLRGVPRQWRPEVAEIRPRALVVAGEQLPDLVAPWLEALHVTDLRDTSLTAVAERFPHLRSLTLDQTIQTVPSLEEVGSLVDLEVLCVRLEARHPKAWEIGGHPGIRALEIGRYPFEDLGELTDRYPALEVAEIHSSGSLRSLTGAPPRLRSLDLWRLSRVESLRGLGTAPALRRLRTQLMSHVRDLDGIQELSGLVRLTVEPTRLSTVRHLTDHPSIEALGLIVAEVEDGSVDPILTMHALRGLRSGLLRQLPAHDAERLGDPEVWCELGVAHQPLAML